MLIQQAARELLLQLSDVLDELKDEDFSRPIQSLSGSSIGQHVRHTIEFFLCLMDGVGKGEINYDNRKHDKFIQEDRKLALSVIASVDEFLTRTLENHPMDLVADYDPKGSESIAIPSSFFRELAYNIEHTIHHMALIKIGLRDVGNYVNIPDHFGVASSTVRYQRGQA